MTLKELNSKLSYKLDENKFLVSKYTISLIRESYLDKPPAEILYTFLTGRENQYSKSFFKTETDDKTGDFIKTDSERMIELYNKLDKKYKST